MFTSYYSSETSPSSSGSSSVTSSWAPHSGHSTCSNRTASSRDTCTLALHTGQIALGISPPQTRIRFCASSGSAGAILAIGSHSVPPVFLDLSQFQRGSIENLQERTASSTADLVKDKSTPRLYWNACFAYRTNSLRHRWCLQALCLGDRIELPLYLSANLIPTLFLEPQASFRR